MSTIVYLAVYAAIIIFTSIRDHGKIIFVMLRDITGVIQIILRKDALPEQEWKRAKEIRNLDRIRIKGVSGFSKTGALSVFAEKVEIIMKKETAATIFTIDEQDSRTLTGQFLLARLQEKACEWMRENGYVEFVPYYITSSRISSHLEPLEVVFPGWGSNAYLIVSPSGQLLKALTVADTKVFCVSRVFSQMVRDGYTSAESMILCAQCFEPNENEMERLGELLIKSIFVNLYTMPDLVVKDWLRSDRNWQIEERDFLDENPSLVKTKMPKIQVCDDTRNALQREINEKAKVQRFFRILWPENVILVEGHIGRVEAVKVGGLVVHLERMIPLLRNVPLRFMRKEHSANSPNS